MDQQINEINRELEQHCSIILQKRISSNAVFWWAGDSSLQNSCLVHYRAEMHETE